MTTLEAFQTVDIRTGTIVSVDDFPEATKPLYKVKVDFGPDIGHKKTGARLKPFYPDKEKLIGKKVVAVVNLPPRVIAGFTSEVLLLGAMDDKTKIFALLLPDRPLPNGKRVY